ncbi:MAG: hypothetical protein ACREYC_01415, partial [Gammaproteobacteria bacterium]
GGFRRDVNDLATGYPAPGEILIWCRQLASVAAKISSGAAAWSAGRSTSPAMRHNRSKCAAS